MKCITCGNEFDNNDISIKECQNCYNKRTIESAKYILDILDNDNELSDFISAVLEVEDTIN